MATFDDFMRLDIRVGTIVEARPFEKARKPAYQLLVDLGPELGRKRSSAQITQQYAPEAVITLEPAVSFGGVYRLPTSSPRCWCWGPIPRAAWC